MTTTVVISAHPAPPNNVVEVSIYTNTPNIPTQEFVLCDGAISTFYISENQQLSVVESFKTIVSAYAQDVVPEPPVDPAPSTTG